MTKEQARDRVLTRRRAMTTQQREEAAEAIALHAAASPVISRARRIACYLSMPSEPGSGPLIASLTAHGATVLVPIARSDHSLDWTLFDPDMPVTTSSLGIREPTGERCGADALAACDVVIVPALAVDHQGHRLGRGAGYYDRALAGVEAPICALVFTDELVASVPSEPHDVPVQMALTPGGLFRVP